MTGYDIKAGYLNAGYSRRAFAEHVDVPEQSLRRLEGGNGISPAYAKRIADFFGVQVTDLMPIERQAA
jgi:plasmid maintenance system antidote protein VapI